MLIGKQNIHDLNKFLNRGGVFCDRAEAGECLAGMLNSYAESYGVVLAIPAGGVPVAAVVAERLKLPIDVAVVSKITPPQNTEVGYGAVAFDGTVRLNRNIMPVYGLTAQQIQAGIAATKEKVQRRVARFRRGRTMEYLANRTIILIDDGLASGFTMSLAVEAVSKIGVRQIVIAVPTAHDRTLEEIEKLPRAPEAIYCPNIRTDPCFAVAEAYRNWSDISEDQAAEVLARFGG